MICPVPFRIVDRTNNSQPWWQVRQVRSHMIRAANAISAATGVAR